MARGSERHNFVTKHKIMKTQSAKTTNRRKAKWTRPVSRKFYQSICRQIHEVSLLSEDITESNVMQCVDDYIDNGSADVEFTDAETVVFILLQPLIDKAIARSLRARAAAARRCQNKVQPDTAATPAPTDTAKSIATTASVVTAEATATQSAMNARREEKRAKRRENAQIRRLEKHRKRLARRQKERHEHYRDKLLTFKRILTRSDKQCRPLRRDAWARASLQWMCYK